MSPNVQLPSVSQLSKRALAALWRGLTNNVWVEILKGEAPIGFYVMVFISAVAGWGLASLPLLAFLTILAVPFIVFLLFEWGPFRPHPCGRQSWKFIFSMAADITHFLELPGIITYCICHFLLTPPL